MSKYYGVALRLINSMVVPGGKGVDGAAKKIERAIAEAVSAEREACARIAEAHDGWSQQIGCPGEDIAAEIRARANQC